MFDVLISGGEVHDGTGAAAVTADVAVSGNRVEDIGDLADAEAHTIIDAGGKVVCPGFIDAHSHSDAYLLIEPSSQSKIYQGVTTEIVGNCGASAAPLVGDYHMPSDWRAHEYPGEWRTVAEYRELIDQVRPAVNVVLLIGHNTLRVGVAGYENRELSDDEGSRMSRLLEESLDEGGRGLSTGLIYAPGMYARQGEIEMLAAIVKKYDGIYTTHMRSEGKRLVEALREAIAIGKHSGVRVEISHLKVGGRANWRLIDDAIEVIEAARAEGQMVRADRYPYVSSSTDLDVVFPGWAAEGGREVVLKRLRDPEDRRKLADDLRSERALEYWGSVTVGSTSHPDNRRFRGMTIVEVSEVMGVEPVDAVLHLVETDELMTGAFFAGMDPSNMKRILALPYVMLGTDASLRAPEGPLAQDHPHPRAYGSFPRFLRMVLDEGLVSFPEAIRKITSLPADQFGLSGRGLLQRGKIADIVVLDRDRLRERATYAEPHRLADGIEHMIVNGELTMSEGVLTGQRAGEFLGG